MRWLVIPLLGLALLLGIVACVALALVASPFPKAPAPRDVFGFGHLEDDPAQGDLPEIGRFEARDGAKLALRLYPSSSERVLVFVHGSSYHGAAYHQLAKSLSASGAARVVLPNLRGHHLSGVRRGDVDYVGQLEDDLADLVAFLRGRGWKGPVTLGGHSSGGGLAIRFAGGEHGGDASSHLLLSPVIPTAPSTRGGDAGGWASLHRRRLFGLLALNALGVRGLNALPIIQFNKPEEFWDGTETLAYSYRLNASYHPRYEYAHDVAALPARRLLVVVGERDEAVDPEALAGIFESSAPGSEFFVAPGVDHFGVFRDAAVLERIGAWLKALPQAGRRDDGLRYGVEP